MRGMEDRNEKKGSERISLEEVRASEPNKPIARPQQVRRKYTQDSFLRGTSSQDKLSVPKRPRQPPMPRESSQTNELTGRKTKIISVISGKGGTGKSLFTAVLGNCLSKEQCKVLLVDLDIHVRGLTILLSKYIGAGEGMSVTDCLENNRKTGKFAVYRFQECEILPAVIDISHPLVKDIEGIAVDDFLERLFAYTRNQYDVVLLDCRSGLDSTLVTIAKKSDFIISISEDDDVCLHSNLNLVTYLRYVERIDNIFTVINKGRRIRSKEDMENKIDAVYDFSCIGLIPFDETIMEDYGKDRFWLTVYDTLYFYGIVKFWNAFRERASISYSINEDKYSFGERKIIRNDMSSTFRIYGFIILIVSLVFSLTTSFIDTYPKNISILTSIVSMLGLLMIVFSTRKFRSFLIGQDDAPRKKQRY